MSTQDNAPSPATEAGRRLTDVEQAAIWDAVNGFDSNYGRLIGPREANARAGRPWCVCRPRAHMPNRPLLRGTDDA